jgi:hypothetical protein
MRNSEKHRLTSDAFAAGPHVVSSFVIVTHFAIKHL